MLKAIDHIIIRSPTPQATMEELEEIFGIEACVPVNDSGLFQSGILRLCNLDIEVMGFGSKKDFKPYFYGIVFESENPKWETISKLNERKLKHTLPILIEAGSDKTKISWDITFLKGLLDYPIPAPCATGFIVGNNWLGKSAARITIILMVLLIFIRKVTSNNMGRSMSFFCHYHFDIDSNYRNKATDTFERLNGGNLYLEKVSHILIEKKPSNTDWDALGSISSNRSAKLSFIDGKANRIKGLILTTMKEESEQKFYIGDACFEVKQA